MKVIINGINGKMGRQLVSHFSQSDTYKIVAGIDKTQPKQEFPFPVEQDVEKVIESGDVVIDFSLPSGTESVLESCLKHKKMLITGTTGISDELNQKLQKASEQIIVVQANNFSIGVNLLFNFVDHMSKKMKNLNFDVELTETHHRQKKDSPSGTARSLLKVIKEQYKNSELNEVYGREGLELSRENQIGVHSVRGGTVIGTHEIQFLGPSENISIKHEALSRNVFVEGVEFCCGKIANKTNGYFTMLDLLGVG